MYRFLRFIHLWTGHYWFEGEVDFIFLEKVGCFVYLPMAMTLCNLAQSQIGKDTRYYFLAVDSQIRNAR